MATLYRKIDAAQTIADRGGAAPGYANDPAKLHACNAWINHARPIIKAWLVLDDAADAPLFNAVVDLNKAHKFGDPRSWQERDYEEARGHIRKAGKELYAMLEGIRDNFICDELAGQSDDPDAQEEADAFNDWLHGETASVDAAVNLVADEPRAAGRDAEGRHE